MMGTEGELPEDKSKETPKQEAQTGTEGETKDPFVGTKYEGKSAEEIAQMHSELESKLGTQSKELGELRGKIEEAEQYGGYNQPQGQQQYQNPLEQAPQQQAPELGPDDDAYIEVGQAKKMMKQELFQRDMQMCHMMGQQAKRRFAKDNPELWKEVGRDTEQWMNNALYYMQIHPNLYATEEGWENAAQVMLLQKHPELVKERFTKPAPATQATGTPPVEGEVPVTGQPPTTGRTPTSTVPEGVQRMWDKMNLSEEDRKAIQKAHEEGRK